MLLPTERVPSPLAVAACELSLPGRQRPVVEAIGRECTPDQTTNCGASLAMHDTMMTTANELAGYKVVQSCGVVRGLTVRSRSVVGNFVGGIQSLFGGKISVYANLCEHARNETYELMREHAEQVGANAVVAVRYDATELMTGLTEVLCYGTAVVVEPVE
jgi:uncharacterized protein YbjQ (UPF0145 family)